MKDAVDLLVLVASAYTGLSMSLSMGSEYGIEHGITYNSAKSNVMIFCCKRFKDKVHILNFVLNGEHCQGLVSLNILGILSQKISVTMITYLSNTREFMVKVTLIRKFYMCTESVKCTLFKSYCTSLYTCQLSPAVVLL